jgi:hypothetical protein
MEKPEKRQIKVYLTLATLAELQENANEEGVTRNALLTRIIHEWQEKRAKARTRRRQQEANNE